MKALVKKILCPIDFDDNSIAALEYARDFAVKNDATLYVLHAVYAPLASPRFPLEPYEGISEGPGMLELQKVAREHLQGRAR